MAQLCSNNRGLAKNYPEENIISQLAENKSAPASPAFCLSYVQIDLDLLEAVQEITQHIPFLVRVLPSRRRVPHFSSAKT